MKRTLARTAAARGDLLQVAADLTDRFAPQPGEHGATLAELAPLRPIADPPLRAPAKPAPVASTIK
jgi:hypothetical protein